MMCENCGGETEARKVTKHHRLDGKLYIVQNVEAEVCPECGERYFHARMLDAIDAMLRGEHSVQETLAVEVVKF